MCWIVSIPIQRGGEVFQREGGLDGRKRHGFTVYAYYNGMNYAPRAPGPMLLGKEALRIGLHRFIIEKERHTMGRPSCGGYLCKSTYVFNILVHPHSQRMNEKKKS